MYTVMLCNPFRDTPYRTYLGTLSPIGIRSQGKFKEEGVWLYPLRGITTLSE